MSQLPRPLPRWLTPLLWSLALAALAVSCPRSHAQQAKLPDPNGSHIFRRILADLGCRPLSSPLDFVGNPAGKIVIALGRSNGGRTANPVYWPSVSWIEFVRAGGSVLLAADKNTRQSFLKELDVTINPGPMRVPAKSEDAYLHGEGFFIKPAGRAPFSSDLKRVATIQPAFLQIGSKSPLEMLAEFPPDAQREGKPDRQSRPVFAAGTDSFEDGNGRILILADQSVFTNALLWQRQGDTQNDNFEFAQNCVAWLTESGKRRDVLFYEDGNIIDDFYTKFIEEPALPLPPIEDVVHAVNQGLYGIEEEDRFNEWLTGLAYRIDVRVVIIVLSVLLTAYGLLRLGQAKYHVEPAVPLLESGLAQLVPSVDLAAQRKRWILRRGNFAEAAQALARQFFDHLQEAGLLQRPEGEQAPPRVQSREGRWRAWRTRREIRRLWRLAHADRPRQISLRQLTALQATLARWRQAVAQGTLEFPQTAGPPPASPAQPAQVREV